MSGVGRARPFGRADVHVRISRIVIDRAVLPSDVGDIRREHLTDRIAAQIAAPTPAEEQPSRPTLVDSIARAVAARVSPQPTPTGRKR